VAQIFPESADTWLRAAVALAIVALVGSFFFGESIVRSAYITQVALTPPQPVPFSHKHHVGELGLDCRFCHTTVEKSADAGFPATHICMTCHSQLWTNAQMLAPVRQSLAENRPLTWRRVARLPDYVYFRHDIHVAKGVSCYECHGRVDEMPLTYRARALTMEMCIDCHRDPAPRLRPQKALFQPEWQAPDPKRMAAILKRHYHVKSGRMLTHCGVCHR